MPSQGSGCAQEVDKPNPTSSSTHHCALAAPSTGRESLQCYREWGRVSTQHPWVQPAQAPLVPPRLGQQPLFSESCHTQRASHRLLHAHFFMAYTKQGSKLSSHSSLFITAVTGSQRVPEKQRQPWPHIQLGLKLLQLPETSLKHKTDRSQWQRMQRNE